ncbi:MAG: LytTR family DNA-binding domain-containing protein [Sediminicola sp.]|tara:strand:- start:123622 stop:124326 length:705 start_codon:yes stop_codon:yes gene_type:complete
MTKVLKCLIVDDEPAAHYVLTNYIGQDPSLELVFQGYNAMEALHYLQHHEVDLMFLDIDMPDMSGLELLANLRTSVKTILTTAYSEFALESYEYRVIDYLLKPIFHPRFEKAVNRLRESLDTEPGAPIATSIQVKVDSETIAIPVETILYTRSYGNYVKIVTHKKNYIATITTSELEKNLPSPFFMRAHKSFIIALQKVEKAQRDHVVIKNTKIPIGITYKRELFERLNNDLKE